MQSRQFQQESAYRNSGPQSNHFQSFKDDIYTEQFKTEFSPLEQSLRNNFIRKVFSLTAVQIFVTGLIVNFFVSQRWFYKLNYQFGGFVLIAGLAAFILSLVLRFSTTASQTVPLNYILLGIFTFAESYCVGFIAGQYDKDTVVTAMYLTAAVVGSLAFYAYKSKTEINYYGGLIVLLSMGVLSLSFINWFTRFGFIESLIFFGGCILSGLYFIYDMKHMLGRNRFKMSLDDYVRGSMQLYLDIVSIFLDVLRIVAAMSKDKEEEERRKNRR